MVKKVLYIIFMFCLIISNLYVPVAEAKTLGDMKKELEEFKEQYEQNKLEKELSEKEKQEIEANINSINNSIYQAGEDIKRLNNEIEVLTQEIAEDEEEIKNILSFTQIQNGESAYLEYAFGAKTFTDFIYRIAVSEQLTSYNEELIEKNKKNIEDNKKKTEELATKKVELAEKQEELTVELNKIKANLQEIDEEALSIEELIKVHESQIKLYEDHGCKDDEDIEVCGKNFLPPDTSFWRPLKEGMISGTLGLYGPRRPCGNGVSCYHYGMDLTTYNANAGTTPVYAVANGMVISVVPLNLVNGKQCGGIKVYIQHNVNGKLYTTGYLHMHSINVKEGQVVTKDTVIGIVGGFESYDNCSTGGHLHLEISTGSFENLNNVTYYSKRYDPSISINFPSRVNSYWYDRVTKY